MITYEPFYKTMKDRGMTTYKLIRDFNISRSLIDRLKHNKPISTVTLNDLCNILNCDVDGIMHQFRTSPTKANKLRTPFGAELIFYICVFIAKVKSLETIKFQGFLWSC